MADKILGVFSHHEHGGQIGTITFRKGKLEGSTPGIQSIVDSRLKRFKGNSKQAFDSLDGWGNGYLWIKPVPVRVSWNSVTSEKELPE